MTTEIDKPPTIYERQDYNGEFNLNAGERDRLLFVLNGTKSLSLASKILCIQGKQLYLLRIKHRIFKQSPHKYESQNKWN